MVQKGKAVPVAFCGRRFSAAEIELVRKLVADFSALGLTEMARTISELLEWKRPNGRLKNHECRLFLEKLGAEGGLSLPTLKQSGPRGPRMVTYTANGEEQEPVTGSVSQFAPLSLSVIHSGPESALWNELIERYPLSGVPGAGRRQSQILRAFAVGPHSGVHVVVQSCLEDDGTRSLDRLDQ
jgi:hypothetical protein